MHRRAGIFRCNENVRLARLICHQKAVARLMDRQFSGDQISLRRQDVTILADPRDLARAFQLAQDLVETHPHSALASQLGRDLVLVEGPVILVPEQSDYFCSYIASVFGHLSENILDET